MTGSSSCIPAESVDALHDLDAHEVLVYVQFESSTNAFELIIMTYRAISTVLKRSHERTVIYEDYHEALELIVWVQ